MIWILLWLWKPLVAVFALGILYLIHVERTITATPEEALAWSPRRWTEEEIREAMEEEEKKPSILSKDDLPPPTGRRYILVGVNCLVGGHIILQLLCRGEPAEAIRIIDNRPPTRTDLLSPPANKVPFVPADIRSLESTLRAFTAPWPASVASSSGVTVFHLAATIRHWERHPFLLPLSNCVNVAGTANVLSAAKSVGASVFIATSSASVLIQSTNLFKCIPFLHPRPKDFCQSYRDGDEKVPQKHSDFFGNYAVSKLEAERLVRGADEKDGNFRTGVLRPGNAVFGSGGDYLSSGFQSRDITPVWIQNTVSSFAYAENVAYAHLLYEKCLVDHEQRAPAQADLGGQAFLITDPNPPISYGDFYRALGLLSRGRCRFPTVPQVAVYLVALGIETWYLGQTLVVHQVIRVLEFLERNVARVFGRLAALLGQWQWFKLKGVEINLQPAVFSLTSVNLWFDDARARRAPAEGGLGYRAPFTSLRGLVKTGLAFERERAEKMAAGRKERLSVRGGAPGEKVSEAGGKAV